MKPFQDGAVHSDYHLTRSLTVHSNHFFFMWQQIIVHVRMRSQKCHFLLRDKTWTPSVHATELYQLGITRLKSVLIDLVLASVSYFPRLAPPQRFSCRIWGREASFPAAAYPSLRHHLPHRLCTSALLWSTFAEAAAESAGWIRRTIYHLSEETKQRFFKWSWSELLKAHKGPIRMHDGPGLMAEAHTC